MAFILLMDNITTYILGMKLNMEIVEKIISAALVEDIGKGDITSSLVIPVNEKGSFVFAAREEIVVCGIPIIEKIFAEVRCKANAKDGDRIKKGQKIFQVSGNARYILEHERVALNLVQRLSGISTITAKYVEAVKGTKARILDTRKTTPGLRHLEKYAVYVGGGENHRMGLYDEILIKDNHISIAGSVAEAIKRTRSGNNNGKTIEVECDTLEQVREAVLAGAQMILLDNMPPSTLKKIVKEIGGKVPLEASGGITLESVREVADSGVDYISVGALTHSVRCVDIGLDEDDIK